MKINGVFSPEILLQPFIMFYHELIHILPHSRGNKTAANLRLIHPDKSGKCGLHARRFGSPSAGSEPRLYCISARPFAATAGHEVEAGPGFTSAAMSGRAGAVASGPVGRTRSGLGGGCVSRRGLLSSRSFRLIRVKLERRPSRGGPQAVVSKSHPSGEPEVYEPCHVATCLFDPVSSL